MNDIARSTCSAALGGNSQSNHQRISWRTIRTIAAAALVILPLSGGLLPETSYAADRYRAFYFNANGELIQVEQVPDTDLPNRTLITADDIKHPRMTTAKAEKIYGANKPMSKFATVAVYYTYDGATEPAQNTEDVRARPVKVEDLQFVQSRTIVVCLQRYGSDPCYYPKRCHCQTACCCY